MGTSTNAIFGFGIDLCEEIENEIFDLPKIAELMEISIEEVKEFEPKEILEFISDLEDTKLCIKTHCSYSSPMQLLLIRETVSVARRGYPENISVSDCFLETATYKKMFANEECYSELGLNKKYIIENYIKPDFIMTSIWGI